MTYWVNVYQGTTQTVGRSWESLADAKEASVTTMLFSGLRTLYRVKITPRAPS